MKILAISHEYPPVGGGGANAGLFLLDAFAREGHGVSLVTTAFKELPPREVTKAGVTIYRVPSRRKMRETCSILEMLSFLVKARSFALRLAEKEHFDIALIFFGIPAGPIGVTLKKKLNLPFIIRFGGSDVPGFRESYAPFYKVLGPSIKKIWRSADGRIANSKGLRDLAYAFCDKYPFEVIPNGVDTCFYTPRGGEARGGSMMSKKLFGVLFVSRLLERKGLQHVIPQLPALRDELEKRGIGLRLTVVGDGPYRDTLERLAADCGVGDICVFTGQKDKNEIVPYYRDADVFILPSAKEGMPNVVLEAMACGLPVIMTPCQGSDELIKGNGFICRPEEFGQRLLDLALDDFSRMVQGRASLGLAREEFSWENTAKLYLDIINRVCSP